MKEYEKLAREQYEETCYIGEGIRSGFLNEDGTYKKHNGKWKEVEPNKNCKKCNGMGYQTYGNDCTCIWKKIKD